jgi:hypothetical protein
MVGIPAKVSPRHGGHASFNEGLHQLLAKRSLFNPSRIFAFTAA